MASQHTYIKQDESIHGDNKPAGTSISLGDKNNDGSGKNNNVTEPMYFDGKDDNGKTVTTSYPLENTNYLQSWSTDSRTKKLIPVKNVEMPGRAITYVYNKSNGKIGKMVHPKAGEQFNVTIEKAGNLNALGGKKPLVFFAASTGDVINDAGEVEKRGQTITWGVDPYSADGEAWIKKYFGDDAYNDAVSTLKQQKTNSGTSGTNDYSKYGGINVH